MGLCLPSQLVAVDHWGHTFSADAHTVAHVLTPMCQGSSEPQAPTPHTDSPPAKQLWQHLELPTASTYLRDFSTLSSLLAGLAPGDSFRRRNIPSRFFMSLALETRAGFSTLQRGLVMGDEEGDTKPQPRSQGHSVLAHRNQLYNQ